MSIHKIFGVNHRVQHLGFLDAEASRVVNEFVLIINNFMSNTKIDLIAEEFNQEACNNCRVPNSILYDLAIKCNIPHLYLEPDTKKRKELNIKSDSIDDRELEWLRRLSLTSYKTAVVVIGNSHVSSFTNKLTLREMQFQIIETEIGESYNPLA